jgi:hypothetical protein
MGMLLETRKREVLSPAQKRLVRTRELEVSGAEVAASALGGLRPKVARLLVFAVRAQHLARFLVV